ncbi:MAG: hypothetical protein V1892_00380 [bacterium]
MMEEKAYFEYSDGSYLEALIRDGDITEEIKIRIVPDGPRIAGTLTVEEAVEFIGNIQKRMRRTKN